jgi:LIVCS family branched-chain amino acid:cation transporter
MTHLTSKDIFALGLMTFALFVGAGNIIFPPLIGMLSGSHAPYAAFGFLLTAVGLPVLTIVAIAKAGGAMESLSSAIGKKASTLLAVVCYLAVGPFFATPRTTTVSFEIGFANLFHHSQTALFIYSLVYFIVVIGVSFYPDRLLETIGKCLAPLKILALAALGITAFLYPAGGLGPATGNYVDHALVQGFLDGYLTMDTLASLVFGIVIINTIKSRGIHTPALLTRYTMIAGLIAGTGLILIYVSLFYLGAFSHTLSAQATNGAEILHAYVQFVFGTPGTVFLAILILIACMVTAIGLTIACAEYFSTLVPLRYKTLVVIFAGMSFLFANLGLTKLTQVSEPVLIAIYPPCIVLVFLSFLSRFWSQHARVIPAAMAVALLFGIIDGLSMTGWHSLTTTIVSSIPLGDEKLGWVLPSILAALIAYMFDKRRTPAP